MRKSHEENRPKIPQSFPDAVRLMMDGRAQAVADHFGKSESWVYAWMQNPKCGGRPMPGHMIVPVSQFLDDYSLIEWLANEVGMVAYRIPMNAANGNFVRLARLTKEFGEGLQVAADVLEDGVVTQNEYLRIRKEFLEFARETMSTLEAFRLQVSHVD